jgi:hypothetical protein
VEDLIACKLRMALDQATIAQYRKKFFEDENADPAKEIKKYASQYNRIQGEIALKWNVRK